MGAPVVQFWGGRIVQEAARAGAPPAQDRPPEGGRVRATVETKSERELAGAPPLGPSFRIVGSFSASNRDDAESEEDHGGRSGEAEEQQVAAGAVPGRSGCGFG